MSRPVLIDPADGPCEICASWVQTERPRKCNRCGGGIGIYENMRGAGFTNPKPHHFHLVPVVGIPGREAIHEELCLSCYHEAFREAYPDAELPVVPCCLSNEVKLDSALLAVPNGVSEAAAPGVPMTAAIADEINRQKQQKTG